MSHNFGHLIISEISILNTLNSIYVVVGSCQDGSRQISHQSWDTNLNQTLDVYLSISYLNIFPGFDVETDIETRILTSEV